MNFLTKNQFKMRLLTGAFLLAVLSLQISRTVSAAEFAIATAHPLATQAGIDILKQGGNAFDAAIAVTTTLAVVEPYSSGLGGGGFYLLHDQKQNKQVMLDAREKAPLAAHRDMYLNAEGEVDHDLSMNGVLSAGIPGIPLALDHLQSRGKLSLKQNLANAIKIAESGFEVDEIYLRMMKFRGDVVKRYESSALFFDQGNIPQIGWRLKQPDLAKTLKIIAETGGKAFYQGGLAEKLVKGVRKNKGTWTKKDLTNYQVIEREPVRFSYAGADIIAATLPSSGGIVLAQIFNMLQLMNFDQLNELQQKHVLIEAMRRAYRDRAAYLGDTDFIDVPKKLLSTDYARLQVSSIKLDRASKSTDLGNIVESKSGSDTTHFSIRDEAGNKVAATLSINYPFGSGLVIEGTGILLNDEMDDFSAKPGVPNAYGLIGSEANAIESGKRMLSSMTPAFVNTTERSLISGTPGGSRIITMQLLAILSFLRGETADQIVALPRFHHQFYPDKVFYEAAALSATKLEQLSRLGHQTKPVGYNYGNMQVIVRDKMGKLDAASDPRGIGKAVP